MPSSAFTDAITHGHFIAPLRADSPLADVGLPKLAVQELTQCGLTNLSQLLACDRAALLSRGLDSVLVSQVQAALDRRGMQLRTVKES